jgi:hypothetical protein
MDATPNTESLKDLVIRMTDEAWNDRGEGLLLARLGDEVVLRGEPAKAELAGRKLSAFIKEELANEIALYTSGADSIVRLALPRKAGISQAQAVSLFPRAAATRKAAEASGVTNAVVQAFSRELEHGKKRVITLSPSIRYRDIDLSADVPGSAKVVPSELIVTGEFSSEEERLRVTLSNIAAWRKSEELAPAAITAKPKVDEPEPKNLLSVLLANLSEQDRKRVQMPLDIIARLQQTPVK